MRYLILSTLVIALLVPDVAFGQRGKGGGGRGGGGHPNNSNSSSGNWHGGNWNGGNWHGGNYHGGYYDHNNNWVPYAAFGLGYALGGWGWNGYGSWPGYYYDSPSYYSDSYPNNSSIPRTSTYYDPMGDARSVSPKQVQLEIIVPDPNAQLLIQGQTMTLMGNRRLFVSPDLEPGKTYAYTVTLKRTLNGRTEDDTREIDVKAGTKRWIDFTQPQMQTLPAPRNSSEGVPGRTSPPPADPPK